MSEGEQDFPVCIIDIICSIKLLSMAGLPSKIPPLIASVPARIIILGEGTAL